MFTTTLDMYFLQTGFFFSAMSSRLILRVRILFQVSPKMLYRPEFKNNPETFSYVNRYAKRKENKLKYTVKPV